MTERKYVVRDAKGGFVSKLSSTAVAVGSVAAAVVAVSPQGAALESLIYNPESMPESDVALGASGGGVGTQPGSAIDKSNGAIPLDAPGASLRDFLYVGQNAAGSSNGTGTPLGGGVLGSILGLQGSGTSLGNVTNSTQVASSSSYGNGTSTTGGGNVSSPTPTSGGGSSAGSGGSGGSGGTGNVTSPTPGGGTSAGTGEDSYDDEGEGDYEGGEESEDDSEGGED